MPRFTQFKSNQIGDEEVKRTDLHIANDASSVIAKVIASTGLTISSSFDTDGTTVVTSGTGDVTLTANLSTGLSGGQTAYGGTGISENLTLSSTTNGTKGKILFGTSAYDEVNNRLGIANASPSYALDVTGAGRFTNTVITQSGLLVNTGLNNSDIILQVSGTTRWAFNKAASTGDLQIARYNSSGVFLDNPLSIILSSGNVRVATLASGNTPPTTNGSTKAVITDADGQLSFATLANGTSGTSGQSGTSGTSGASLSYNSTFTTATWSAPSSGLSSIAFTHNLSSTNLVIDLYEDIGAGVYSQFIPYAVELTSSTVVTVYVQVGVETDGRCNGKIVINGSAAFGTSGTSGSSGTSAVDGTSGTSGSNGTSGTSGAGYIGITSTSSTAIATGSKTFTVSPNVGGFVVGSRVRVANTVTPSNYMEGITTAASGTSITINVDVTGGSGTFASWNFSLAGNPGSVGTSGTSGVNGDPLTEVTISGTQNGTNKTFTLAGALTSPISLLFFNGSLLINGIDYTISGTTLTFDTSFPAPDSTDSIKLYGATGISSGTSGTSGVAVNGTSGTSGITVNGTSGTSGSSGTSAINGTSGSSGITVSGTSGTSGITVSGTSGTSGLSKPASITLVSPTAAENISLFYTNVALTVSLVADSIRGTSPSVTYNIRWASTRDSGTPTNLFSANRTVTSTTGSTTSTFANASIPANSYVWLITSASSGVIDDCGVSIIFS